MNNAVVIIISGAPGTGKTTLANRIAEKFSLSLISKDGIKETLFDSLGIGDREWSRKLGFSSYRLMWHFLESALKAGGSVIVESNFRPRDLGTLLELRNRYTFKILQVYCDAEKDVILRRYNERARSGARHPGHLDNIVNRELEEELREGGYAPLDIGEETLRIDTTDFDRIDYTGLYARIERFVDA